MHKNPHGPIPGFVGSVAAATDDDDDDDDDPPVSLQAIETVLPSLIKIGSIFFVQNVAQLKLFHVSADFWVRTRKKQWQKLQHFFLNKSSNNKKYSQ